MDGSILGFNKAYWDAYADNWAERATALPDYGVNLTENDLRLFGDVSGKKLLDICCGSGHSLKYHADRNAAELWGLDISHTQIALADEYLKQNGCTAKLVCAPMEAESGVPADYFDYVYSVYGIGWTTDLEGAFRKIASYLKKDGIFIFSWHHTLNYCVAFSIPQRQVVMEDGKLVFHRSYFDESWFRMPIDGSEVALCNRKISTYVNALAQAGFVIEQMIERPGQSSEDNSDRAKKAQMLPISVCFKARKL
jgi:SAM-dependent methyltransferase